MAVVLATAFLVVAAPAIDRPVEILDPGTGPPPKVRDGVANGMPQTRADVEATPQGALLLPPGNR